MATVVSYYDSIPIAGEKSLKKVQFRRPNLLRFHETYSSDEYDRTSIQVIPHNLALPERGDRVYNDAENNSIEDHAKAERQPRLDHLTSQLGDLSLNSDLAGPPQLMTSAGSLPSIPVAVVVDSDSDDDETLRARAFCLRRAGTPLPPLYLDGCDSEDEESSSKLLSSLNKITDLLADPSCSEELGGCFSLGSYSTSELSVIAS
jgi:hypothetical protein